MTAPPRDRVLVCLAALLAINFLVTAAFHLSVAAATGLTKGTATQALKATAPGQTLRLRRLGTVDSWRPMLRAYNRKLEDPRSDLYEVFFVDRVKFQYLPSSLLIFDLFPRSMTMIVGDVVGIPLRRWLAWSSRIAVGLAALASALILEIGLRRASPGQPAPPARIAASIGLSLALGVTFYPLLFAYDLGQIQVFLNALLALGILCYLLGRPALAGVCFGACCLVKPQYGLVLVWSLLRRQWRFTLGLAGVLSSGLALSIARFGLADHLRYLDVIREVSLGESYWTNQSVNGLLHRLLGHGDQLKPVITEFAPYDPVVYALTVLSSVAFLALALWPRRQGRAPDGGPVRPHDHARRCHDGFAGRLDPPLRTLPGHLRSHGPHRALHPAVGPVHCPPIGSQLCGRGQPLDLA